MPETLVNVVAGVFTEDVKTRRVGDAGPHIQISEPPTVDLAVILSLTATGQVVRASDSLLHSIEVFNDDVDIVYVKAYNKATTPTNGDTPLHVWRVMPGDPKFNLEWANGLKFPLGLGLRATTGRAHADNTSPTADTVLVNVGDRAG